MILFINKCDYHSLIRNNLMLIYMEEKIQSIKKWVINKWIILLLFIKIHVNNQHKLTLRDTSSSAQKTPLKSKVQKTLP